MYQIHVIIKKIDFQLLQRPRVFDKLEVLYIHNRRARGA